MSNGKKAEKPIVAWDVDKFPRRMQRWLAWFGLFVLLLWSSEFISPGLILGRPGGVAFLLILSIVWACFLLIYFKWIRHSGFDDIDTPSDRN